MARKSVAIAGIGFFTLIVSCQGATVDDEGLDNLPVVLSASRLRQSVYEAPAPVSVIDQRMIKSSGLRTIPELLRLVPGFLVSQLNGNSFSTTNQGLADGYSRQMQVLIDGRSIYSPLFGGVNWADIPITLSDIERIEVVRGPNAASFGANSFLGVINIITREPGAEQGNHFEWIQGDEGISEFTLRHAGGDGPMRYRTTVSQSSDNGFRDLYDSQQTSKANFRSELQIDSVNQLQFQAGYVGGVRGQQSIKGGATDGPRDRSVNSAFAQIRWTQRNATDDEWWIQYFHDERSASEKIVFPLQPLTNAYTISYDMDTRRDDIELQRTIALSDDVRMTWGGQMRWDAARSMTYLGTNAWVPSSLERLFANMEWRAFSRVSLNMGLMYERSSLAAANYSPRVAVNWEFVPHHSLRVSWGKAERTPTILEAKANSAFYWNGTLLKQNFFVPTTAKTELNETREFAYLGEMPDWHLSWEARGFSSKITGLLATADTPFPGQVNSLARQCSNGAGQCSLTFANSDNVNLSGADYTFRWSPFDTTRLYFSGSDLWVDSTSTNHSSLILQSPSFTSSFLLDQTLPWGWQLGVGIYRVGAMKWAGGDYLPSYSKADIKVGYRFNLPEGNSAEISWVTENASRPIADFWGYIKPSQISTLRLSVEF